MATSRDSTFYVQLEPVWGSRLYGSDELRLDHVRAVRMTQDKPKKPLPGVVMVKLTVRIPEAAFRPLRPEAIIEIPEALTTHTPIEVVADDPGQED